MSDITAILTVYRRPYTLVEQLNAIRNQSVPPRAIWAFAQEPSEETVTRLAGLGLDRVICCDPNSYYHLRFAVAMAVQTQFACIFDDDAIPGNRWFENCLQSMQRAPGILGTHGTTYIDLHAYYNRSLAGWRSPSDETLRVDYVGQVWFLRPRWIGYLFQEPLATGTNAEDIELGARAARLGGVASFVPPHPANDRSLWGCIDGLRYGEDAAASYHRPGFADERFQILHGEVRAGWRPLCLSEPSNREPLLAGAP